MGKPVLNAASLAELGPSRGGGHLLAKVLLKLFVLRDRHGAPVASLGRRAFGPQRADVAPVRVELDDGPELEGDRLPVRAGDGPVAHVELERRLGEQAPVLGVPGLADDIASSREHVIHDGAVDVSAVDVQLADLEPLPLHILLQYRGGLRLRTVGRGHCRSQDEIPIQVSSQVLLVPVETLALALPPVAHLRILDGDASVLRDSFPNALSPTAWIRLEVLGTDLLKNLDAVLQGR